MAMTTWEYLIISLPPFEAPTQLPSGSPALRALEEVGQEGWEAVGMTLLANESVAVLLKRPKR